MIDPKKIELSLYRNIQNHFLAMLPDSDEPIITDTSKALDTLNSVTKEMDERYDLLKMAMVRDARKGKLCIRFVMVDSQLQVRRGILGIASGFGSSAENTVRATEHIFDEFSKVDLDGKRMVVSNAIRKKLRATCKVICQDSAADEVLAAEIPQSCRDGTPHCAICLQFCFCLAQGGRR